MDEDVERLVEWNKTLPPRMEFFDWFYSSWGGRLIRNQYKDLPEFEGYTTPDFVNETTKRTFTEQEKEILRPIAEVLAMLDGNAFFTMTTTNGDNEWYEMYLKEASYIYESNGGNEGWAGEASFAKRVLNNDREIQD